MPATAPPLTHDPADQLARLGERLRLHRKRQGISATAAAESAGMSRVTLHRIERGEPSVTMGAWVSIATALGLQLDLRDPGASREAPALPDRIRLADYPQLQKLAWQLQGVEDVSPQEALSIYERNWRHVDGNTLTMKEIALVHALATALGGGRLLV
ncbi:XRE family transcriptional regulator [Ramlibacter henchirensis]|uniref:XRE family transcriptional regulator n=1 Tax=Ramlibacter henchirensis TaxID=204072 RepID=A0A4Z0BUW4_9BURK|nr:helix-turn-helix transcriptional regulator [Ramlibacter henchirensis]TFZ02180.1 XRE family transcriptional regulator [Ramlibacter henchirensis]